MGWGWVAQGDSPTPGSRLLEVIYVSDLILTVISNPSAWEDYPQCNHRNHRLLALTANLKLALFIFIYTKLCFSSHLIRFLSSFKELVSKYYTLLITDFIFSYKFRQVFFWCQQDWNNFKELHPESSWRDCGCREGNGDLFLWLAGCCWQSTVHSLRSKCQRI